MSLATAAACTALFSRHASAQTLTWDPDGDPSNGVGGTGLWNFSVPANLAWDDDNTAPNVVWSNLATNVALFRDTAGTVSISEPLQANGLTFNINGYTIDNNATPANILTLAGTTPTINVINSGETATISAILAGTTMDKTGAGTLVLSGANTLSGAVTLNTGTLRATTNAAALGAGTLTLAGGTLQLADDTGLNFGRATSVTTADATIVSDRVTVGAGVTQTLGNLTVTLGRTVNISAGANVTSGTAGVTFGSLGAAAGTGTYTINTNANAVTTFTAAATIGTGNTLIIDGAGNTNFNTTAAASNTGNLTKNGAGTLTVNVDPNWTGTTTVNNGIINFTTSTTDSNTIVNSGGTFLATGDNRLNDGNTMTVNTGGVYDLRGNDTISRLLSPATSGGIVTRGTAGTSTLTLNSGTAGTFGGVIENGAGTVAISKAGTSTVTLTGTNTFTGNVAIGNGAILVEGVNGRLSGGGNIATVGDNNGNDESLILGNVADSIAGTLDRVGDTTTLRFNGTTSINYNGAAVAGGATVETAGTLDYAAGSGIFTLTPASGGEVQVNFTTLARLNNNATGVIRGPNLGAPAGTANSTRVRFSTAPTLIGGSSGIIPFLIGGTSNTAAPNTFLGYNATDGVQPVTSFAATIAAGAGLNVSTAGGEAVAADVTINALRVTGGTTTLNAGTTLVIDSGALLFTGTATVQGPGRLAIGAPAGTSRQGVIHASADASITGTISADLYAAGGLLIGDAGAAPNTVQLSGNNSIVGGVVVNNGILRAGSAGALNQQYFNDLILRAGNSAVTGATSTAFQLGGNSLSVLFGGDDRLQGSTRIQNASATPATLTVITSATSNANDGVMEDGTGGGALGFTKRGASTLQLEQNNTYTGPTELLQATLQLTTANARLSGTSAITIRSGATLNLNNSNTANQTDRLNNAAAISMHGGALQHDNNQNTTNYSEVAGALNVLNGQNTITTDFAATGQTETLTFASLSRPAGGAVNFQGFNTAGDVGIGEGASRNRVVFTAAPTNSAGGIVGGNAYHTKDFNTAATQDVLHFATYSADVDGVTAGNQPSIAAFTAYNTGAEGTWAATTVANPAASPTLSANRTIEAVRLGGGIGLTLTGFTLNLSQGGLIHNGASSTIAGGTLTAGGAAPGELAIRVEDNLTTSLLTLNSNITDNTGGAVSLLKTGADNLTLGGANTYTGRTTLAGGVVNISADNNLGAAPASATPGHLRLYGTNLNVTSSMALAANRGIEIGGGANTISAAAGTVVTYGGSITSNGVSSLTLTGDIDMTLSAASTVGGGLTVQGTTAPGGSVIALAGASNVIGEGLTVAGSSNSATLNYAVAGGTLTVGSGNPNVSNLDIGSRLAAAALFPNEGTLNLTGSANFVATVDRVRLGVLAVDPSSDQITRGVVTLPADASIFAGTEVMLSDSPFDALSAVTNQSSIAFGAGNSTLVSPLVSVGGRKGNGLVTIAAGGTLHYRGIAPGTGDLFVGRNNQGNTGASNVGAFNMTGGTLIAELDEIIVGHKSGTGGNAAGSTGTFTLGATANAVKVNGVTLGDSQGDSTGNASGTLNMGGGTFTVSGNVAIASRIGTAGVATGVLNLTGGTFTVGGNIVTTNSASATSTLTLDTAGALDMTAGSIAVDTFNARAGTLSNVAQVFTGDGTTPAVLVKSTAGTLTILGTNAYTAGTTVGSGATSGGVLIVNGSLTATSNAIAINNGTIKGNGTIAGPLNVGDAALTSGLPDAVVAPGGSIGTLTSGTATLATDATFQLEFQSSDLTKDVLAVSGGLNLVGLPDLSVLDIGVDTPLALGTAIPFITYTGAWDGGLFEVAGVGAVADENETFVVGSNAFQIDYNRGGNSVALVVAVPEPGTGVALVGLAGASLLGRRRRRTA